MLSYEEYKDFGFEDIGETEFTKLVRKATEVMHHSTRRFYVFNPISEDVEWRRKAFKQAIGAQVEYFYETGATSSYGLNEPQTVTIGRTSIGERSSPAGSNQSVQSLISSDALMYLDGTGLLYRGVGVR